jgi:phosphoribosyl-ATP pyrophosphohydrolase/phosphoribosyl-AMP cyclohydrolase
MMDLNFDKLNGLVPVVVQDWKTLKVLMVGFMNQEAYDKTVREGYVTFYSRSRQELWTKGETSGNYLKVRDMAEDCDQDSLLILAEPFGNVCHTGRYSCFDQKPEQPLGFLSQLEELLRQRKKEMPEGSYTAKLFDAGINKIAQKVGEEAVELVIEAKDTNRELLLNEGADLIYHLLVLLVYKDYSLNDIVQVLESRY